MNILKLEETNSTNTWVIEHESELESPSLVYCVAQTAGRGQRGNSWESEPGKNITATLIFHPKNFPAYRQFMISEAVALAIVEYLKEKGIHAKIKWPNDIYVGDKKICGILVEHVVLGKNITRTIAGFGINLNQESFHSDAPNPVSLFQITGEKYDIDREVREVAYFLKKNIIPIEENNNLHEKFLNLLWRKDGQHYKFYDRVNSEMITAEILNVAPDGILTVRTREGIEREFAFKEIEYIL